jgi:hypothetical protein
MVEAQVDMASPSALSWLLVSPALVTLVAFPLVTPGMGFFGSYLFINWELLEDRYFI